MTEPRIEHFERDGMAMVAMPLADWEALEEKLEDDYLSRIANEWREGPREVGIPFALATLIIDGEHPLKVYREHHGLSQAQLAEKVGVQQPAIAQIENRKRTGRPALLAKLAAALEMPLETLMDFG
jgi:DNA-binding XRE family transcriptional regulator